ncbi:MAG: hypothetical protein DBX45_09220 [Oscillospiraceae bacterium]|nr:MAG: hypothetical protein DBX45_09220 [Oscillospiraceae bacterium]
MGRPDASRHRVPGGIGLAVRDPRFSGARGGRLRRRCPGGRGECHGRGRGRRDRRPYGRARRRARRRRRCRARRRRAGFWCVPAGRGRRRRLGRVQAFRRRLVARCDRCRWRCCVHGRVACVRAVRGACGRGL